MYDDIAEVYHLVYVDWHDTVARHGAALDALLRARLGGGPFSIRDVACGIGTQSLGLAALGHRVTASDIAVGAVARARREANARGLEIDLRVGDMSRCDEEHDGRFDALVCADNALPHLLDDASIEAALRAFRRCLRAGGVALIGLRDYGAITERPAAEALPYGFREEGEDRWYVFQTRRWAGTHYDVAMYFVREASATQPALIVAGRSRYYAIPIERVMQLARSAGFAGVERLDGVMHQPLLIARRER